MPDPTPNGSPPSPDGLVSAAQLDAAMEACNVPALVRPVLFAGGPGVRTRMPYRRAVCAWLAAQGSTPAEIAKATNRTEWTVNDWLKRTENKAPEPVTKRHGSQGQAERQMEYLVERYRLYQISENEDGWADDMLRDLLHDIERMSRVDDPANKLRDLPEDRWNHPLRRPWDEAA